MTEAVKKNGIKFGTIQGVISILSTTIIYSFDPSKFVSIGVGISLFAVSLIVGIYSVIATKKQLGGYIEFKEAFTVYFITMALGALLGTLFMGILFNLIDPSIKEVISERVIEMTVKMMQSVGAKTEDIRKSVEQMKESDSFSFLGLLKSYLGNLVMTIIVGLIIAAITKKSRPFEFPSENNTNNTGSEEE